MINGPDVWQHDRYAAAERLARDDKSSKTGSGPIDTKQGDFNKGSHTGSPCNVNLIHYWAQVLQNS